MEQFQSKEEDLRWQKVLSSRMDTFEKQLADNTAATEAIKTNTQGIVDAFQAMQGGLKVLDTLGRVFKPVAAFVAAVVGVVTAWFSWKSS
jgi:hypothetical protein